VTVDRPLWRKARLPHTATLREAAQSLNETSLKIVLIVGEQEKLLGTLSDGDIRRGLLHGTSLDDVVVDIMKTDPFVVPEAIERELVLQLMHANKIQQVPVVNAYNQVVGLHQWDDVATSVERTNTMVIMAGGKGTRLRPHTENCPKPMLEVAGKPMLEHVIERAKIEGFNHFVLSIHYMGHMIENHFGDGGRFGVKIDYLKEDNPIGTAGALSLFEIRPNLPFVVTNGDVITDIRYGELVDFHNRHKATATMAVRLHEWEHPFGVVKMNGVEIMGFEEKPIARSHINAGVYVLDPSVLDHLGHDDYCDMPTLFERLREINDRIVAYPMHEPWLDVGRPDDLLQIRAEYEQV